MRRTVTIFLACGLSFFSPNSGDAIVMRHDRDEQSYLNLALNYPASVTVRRADGGNGLGDESTLIDPHWILTAAHVAAELGPGDQAEVRGVTIT